VYIRQPGGLTVMGPRQLLQIKYRSNIEILRASKSHMLSLIALLIFATLSVFKTHSKPMILFRFCLFSFQFIRTLPNVFNCDHRV